MADLLRPKDLKQIASDAEMAKMDEERELQKEEAAAASRSCARRSCEREVHPEAIDRINSGRAHRRRAAGTISPGRDVSVHLLQDGGRRINIADPEWPSTLRASPRMPTSSSKRSCARSDTSCHAEIISFPGGMPGEVGAVPEVVRASAHVRAEGADRHDQEGRGSLSCGEHDKYERLIAAAKRCRRLRQPSPILAMRPRLRGAAGGRRAGMIVPILVGPKDKIQDVARSSRSEHRRLRDRRRSATARRRPKGGRARAQGQGRAADEGKPAFRRAAGGGDAKRETGLRTGRRISHVFVMDVPTHPETLFITDAAVNIAPDLMAKRDIIQNAIDLYAALGLGTPKVAILSAVETVTPSIPSTIEAAALCKMADRGQITGGELDGPLAFDNAISPEAARIKGIKSPVAGQAQILVVPDLEAGNMLAKNLTFLSQRRCRRHRARRPRADHPDIAGRQRADAHGVVRRGDAAGAQQQSQRACSGLSHDRKPSSWSMPAARASSFSCSRLLRATGSSGASRDRSRASARAPACSPRIGRGGLLVDQTWPADGSGTACRRRSTRSSTSCAGRSAARCRLRSATASCTAAPTTARRSSSDDAVLKRLERLPRSRRCTSPTTWLQSGRSCSGSRSCCRSPASIPPFIAAIRRLPTASRFPSRSMREGVRRYGFHGLSYEYIAERLADESRPKLPTAAWSLRISAAAPPCARSSAGKSVESTMGFTALDGLPMGTRPGQLDPGVVLYLMSEKGMSAKEIERLLYNECGLKGLSGISNDVRELLASADPRGEAGARIFRLPHRALRRDARRRHGRHRRLRVHGRASERTRRPSARRCCGGSRGSASSWIRQANAKGEPADLAQAVARRLLRHSDRRGADDRRHTLARPARAHERSSEEKRA